MPAGGWDAEGVGYINKRKTKLLTHLLLFSRYLKVSDSLITLNDILSPNCTTVVEFKENDHDTIIMGS